MTSPLLRWAGGKRYLAPRIVEILPVEGRRLVEPMCGSAAFYLAARDAGLAPRAWLNDKNARIMNLFAHAQRHPTRLCRAVRDLEKELATLDAEQRYYEARSIVNTWDDEVFSATRGVGKDFERHAAATFYVNRTCFNGLWRENQSGGLNVPFGRRPFRWTPEEVHAFGKALVNVRLTSWDALNVLAECGAGDLVYVDPPYAGDGHAAYTAAGFDDNDHAALAEASRQAWLRGARVVASNANLPEVRQWWSWAHVMEVSNARSISRDGRARGQKRELLLLSDHST